MEKEDIKDILSSDMSIEDMSKNLIDIANMNSGKDNVSVVLIKNN